ncbi:hypothetical protein IMCC12053_2281 [Celeribacter marinus]|uniref:Uncharacterized protein n=1 Tax=Celeribacter marinus TaxID=1397108 RepID=A0A0P0A6E3_9RHOB|nr:hypothetical protein IMCC12053_2281 [Celeribacter marinus]
MIFSIGIILLVRWFHVGIGWGVVALSALASRRLSVEFNIGHTF